MLSDTGKQKRGLPSIEHQSQIKYHTFQNTIIMLCKKLNKIKKNKHVKLYNIHKKSM